MFALHWPNTLWDLALGLTIYTQICKEAGRKKCDCEMKFVGF